MDSRKPWMRFGGAAGLVASGLIAGGVLAGTFTATAAEDTPAPESSTSQQAGEELLTGDTKSQVEAAVLAEYPGATIERTETESGGGYESHIVTADGERLTVLVGEDFAVTGTEAGGRGGRARGPGRGVPGGRRRPRAPRSPAPGTGEPDHRGAGQQLTARVRSGPARGRRTSGTGPGRTDFGTWRRRRSPGRRPRG